MKISTYFFILTLTFVAYGCNKEKKDEIVDTPSVVPNLIDMYATAIRCRPLCPKKGDCAIIIKLEDLKKEYKEIKK